MSRNGLPAGWRRWWVIDNPLHKTHNSGDKQMTILTCQAMFGLERGEQLAALVERATDRPCPCKQGRVCPLLPPVSAEPEPASVA